MGRGENDIFNSPHIHDGSLKVCLQKKKKKPKNKKTENKVYKDFCSVYHRKSEFLTMCKSHME